MEIGIYEKELDFQGRVVIPASLRARLKKFFLLVYKDYLKLVPKERAKLTDFIDSVEVDVKTLEYHKLKRELLGKKYLGE